MTIDYASEQGRVAGPATARPDGTVMRAELELVESQRRAAMVAGDLKTLDALLDDQATYVHSNGLVESKSEYLELIRLGAYQYTEVSQPEMTIRFVGDVALVTGRTILRVLLPDGGIKTVNGRSIVVWARVGGNWRMQFYQGTALPA